MDGDSETAADWNLDLHPRGHDDRFIEIGGLIRLRTGTKEKRFGRDRDLSNARGQVIDIDPDPKIPGEPNIRVKGKDNDGKGFEITVKPDRIAQAEDKASPDTEPEEAPEPDAPEAREAEAGEPEQRLSRTERKATKKQAERERKAAEEQAEQELMQSRREAFEAQARATRAERGIPEPVVPTTQELPSAYERVKAQETRRAQMEAATGADQIRFYPETHQPRLDWDQPEMPSLPELIEPAKPTPGWYNVAPVARGA